MIRIELKHIKKGGFFKIANVTNATLWRKGERTSNKKATWIYEGDKDEKAATLNPNRKVYTKIEYIKPSKALDVLNLEFV